MFGRLVRPNESHRPVVRYLENAVGYGDRGTTVDRVKFPASHAMLAKTYWHHDTEQQLHWAAVILVSKRKTMRREAGNLETASRPRQLDKAF